MFSFCMQDYFNAFLSGKKWRFTSCSVEIVDKIEISCAPDFTRDNYNSLPNKGKKLVSNNFVLKWP